MIKLELNLRGFEAKAFNLKHSEFRKTLLEFCKTSFDQFFSEQAKETRKTMDEEQLMKFRQRLFGNIKFVGELNRRNLLSESIIISVFNMLLGIEEQYKNKVDNDTYEGANILANKIGYLLDEKLYKLKNKNETEEVKA